MCFSCKPAERIGRIAEKYNLKTIKDTTILINDTMRLAVPSLFIKNDTALYFHNYNDKTAGRIVVKKDTVYFETIRTDTITVPQTVIKSESVVKKKNNRASWFGIGALFGICLMFVGWCILLYINEKDKW